LDYCFTEFNFSERDREKLLKKIHKIFQDLLLRTNGDVEEALQILSSLGEKHEMFSTDLSIDDFKNYIRDQNTIQIGKGGKLRLTAKGEKLISSASLEAVFGALKRGGVGEHRTSGPGDGVELLPETKNYEFGDDPSLIDQPGSLLNNIRRTGSYDLNLERRDMQVYETERLTSCATVLMVDVSHSMILYGEDRITPAKQVALALTELIRNKYSKDSIDVILFGDTAWKVPVEELTYISAGPYHTNTRAGLQMAQEILRRKKQSNRQIFMITDGKPSALTERNGEIYKNPNGLDQRIINKTLEEAEMCRRRGIPVTTFMVTNDPPLVKFVQKFTETCHGRAYYAQLDKLGSFVFEDYIKNRKRRVF